MKDAPNQKHRNLLSTHAKPVTGATARIYFAPAIRPEQCGRIEERPAWGWLYRLLRKFVDASRALPFAQPQAGREVSGKEESFAEDPFGPQRTNRKQIDVRSL
jgi:hypothetical protein